MLIDMKVFYKLIILSLMGLARDAQNTQLKHQAVRDNFVKKTIKPTSTSIVESLYSSCHSFQFASNSLPDLQGPNQPKDGSDYRFRTQKNWRPNSTFFSLPMLSKTVETVNKKIFVPKNKTHHLKQSIFV